MRFSVLATSGTARRGRLELAHGTVETPVFMPVGTYGTVKAMAPAELVDVGSQIVLGNTFHLWLRPGLDVIGSHGGLHRLMGWDRPILPELGRFQVLGLRPLRRVAEEGVTFGIPDLRVAHGFDPGLQPILQRREQVEAGDALHAIH